MRKFAVALLSAAALAIGAVPAVAKQETPGTAGDPNCHGQTIAYIAQGGLLPGIRGLGNVAKSAGASTKVVQEIARGHCAAL